MTGFTAAFEWARRQVSQGTLPTAVLGIATTEGTVALEAFGGGATRPARVDDHYRLFSVTKPLVGLTAARAIERGLLGTETPLSDALPGFGARRDDVVRLRHLASHTSGIAEPLMDSAPPLREEILAAGRDFAAGTVSRYSTLAFEGIAALIAHATGNEWDAELAAWAEGVGAGGLTLDEAADPHPVVGAAEAGLDVAAFARKRHPGAGLIGRAEDLLAIGAALLRAASGGPDAGDGTTVVRPATLSMMRRPLTDGIPRLDPYPVERGQDWGFTWNMPTRAPGLIDRDAFGHGGWSGAEFWMHPSAGVAYVFLTNAALPDLDTDRLDNAVIGGL
jgi:CubicO group peptidase (beta-lactamase class C family)